MRNDGGRQGKTFKIDTSTLLQMAFPGLNKALVMWLSLKRLSLSASLWDFLNLSEVKYNRRVAKTIFYFNQKTFWERLSLELDLKIEFWLPSNGSQLVTAWTPGKEILMRDPTEIPKFKCYNFWTEINFETL